MRPRQANGNCGLLKRAPTPRQQEKVRWCTCTKGRVTGRRVIKWEGVPDGLDKAPGWQHMGQIVKGITETELIPTTWIRKMVSAWATGGILISFRYTGRLFLSCLFSDHSSEVDYLFSTLMNLNRALFLYFPSVLQLPFPGPTVWMNDSSSQAWEGLSAPLHSLQTYPVQMQLLALVFPLGLISPFPSQTLTSHFPPWPISFTAAIYYNPPLSLISSLWH
jgi:hypothetical protein